MADSEEDMKSDVDSDDSNNTENSVAPPVSDREKTVEYSDELMDRGSKAVKDCDYGEAVRCYKRALGIRLAHFGQCTRQCTDAYNEYGCALLYEAGALKSDFFFHTPDDVEDKPVEWKLLSIAQGIIEKHSGVTMENVDILLALAEVTWKERKDEISVSYRLKALSMLEQLVEPDNLLIAELNYKICVSYQDVHKLREAVPYCEKAISICQSRTGLLLDEVNMLIRAEETTTASETREAAEPPAITTTTVNNDVVLDGVADNLEALSRKLSEVHDKLEELMRATDTLRELVIIMNRWQFQLRAIFRPR